MPPPQDPLMLACINGNNELEIKKAVVVDGTTTGGRPESDSKRPRRADPLCDSGSDSDINAFLQFVGFGHSVGSSLYFNRNEACRNVAAALHKAGFDVDSIKQLLQRKFIPGYEGLYSVSDDGKVYVDKKWAPFELAVYEGIKSSLRHSHSKIRNLVNEQLQKLIDYGALARAANDILQCGEILKKIVPEGIEAPDFTAYLQRCTTDEKRNLFIDANVFKMGSADFAEWLWTQYADTIKASFPGADKHFRATLKKEGIDGDFYSTMDVETLYETFQELFADYGAPPEIDYIAAVLSRDSTYWRDLYNMFHYAPLFLQENMAYLPFKVRTRTTKVFKL